MVNAQHMQRQPITARICVDKGFHFHREYWNPVKKHSRAFVFFAVSKQIPIVYSTDRGRAENMLKIPIMHIVLPWMGTLATRNCNFPSFF